MAPSVWWLQYRELLLIRWTLSKRNLGVTLSQLLIGAVACATLSLFQVLANQILGSSTPHYPSVPIGSIPRCSPDATVSRPTLDGLSSEPGCYTLLYAPDIPEMRALVASAIASSPQLALGVDVAPVPGLSTACASSTALVNNTLFVQLGSAATCQTAAGGCADPRVPSFPDKLVCVPCALACDNRTMADLTTSFPGSVQTLVWGMTTYYHALFPEGPMDLSYSISYNLSQTQFPFNKPAYAAEVKRALDVALLSSNGTLPQPQLDFSLRQYPKPPPRISGFDVFSQSGGQWTFLTSALLFFQLLTSIAVEKEEKLRVGMRQMGLRTSAYWAAWGTVALLVSAASTLVLLASGYAAGFTFFTNSTPLATAPLYFLTSLSYAAFALLLSSLVTTGKAAQQLGYSVALVSFMFISVLGSGSGVLLNLLYSAQLKPWMVAVRRGLLFLSPALAYTTVLYDISNQASNTLDLAAQRIIPGPGFRPSDLTQARAVTVLGYVCNVPSPLFHLGVIALDGALYLALGLYLDAVLPGPQGSPAHPLFFLGATYKHKAIVPPPALQAQAQGSSAEDPGVAAERRAAALEDSATTPMAVVITDLWVVYRGSLTALFYALTGIEWRELWGWLGRWGRGTATATATFAASGAASDGASSNTGGGLGEGDVLAVEGLSLTVRRGEIVALLGHNGAGKSTTIHVLTGLLSAAAGRAVVGGVDLVGGGGRPAGATALGVCPQHDLLFPDLSAREMLQLFCALKGLPPAAWAAEVAAGLASVNLADVADRRTATFSGGMKRRLSIALATLGSPGLLLFDEPSTGLDPLARADLLQLIQSFKRSSGIILTTHAMSEAAALGDRVAIMAQGRLVALGSTVELTQRYGKGYSVALTLSSGSAEAFEGVHAQVRAAASAAALSLRDGAAVTYTVPFASVDEQLPGLLRWCDAAVLQAGAVVKEFGVSGPSLEEAFLEVTKASKYLLAEAVVGGGEAGEAAEEEQGGAAPSSGARQGDYVALSASGAALPLPLPSSPPPTRQYFALVTKHLTLLSRQRGLCLCQLLTPLLILGLLLVLEQIVATEVGLVSVFIIPPIYLPLNVYPDPLTSWFEGSSSSSSSSHKGLGDPSTRSLLTLLSVFSQPPSARPAALRALQASAVQAQNSQSMGEWADSSSSSSSSGSSSGSGRQLQAPPPSSYSYAGTSCTRFYLSSVQPKLGQGTTPQSLAALVSQVGTLPYGSQPGNASAAQRLRPVGSGFLNMSALSQHGCALRNHTLIATPYFSPRLRADLAMADGRDGGERVSLSIDDELMSNLMDLNAVDSSVLKYPAPCWDPHSPPSDPAAYERANCPALLLPDGAWIFHDLRQPSPATPGGALSVTIQPNTAASTSYHRPNGVSRPMPPSPGVLILDAAKLGAMDLLTRAFAEWSAGGSSAEEGAAPRATAAAGAAAPSPPAHFPLLTFASTMAERRVQLSSDIVEILGAVLFVILLSAPLPLFVFVHVTEKELRLNEMQMIMGLKALPMQAVNFGVNAAIYASIVGLFWGVAGGYMHLRTMLHTSPALLSLTFLGHGLALTATGSLISAFIWDRQVATVSGVVLGIITPLIATAIMAGVYGQNLPWALGVAPPPALYAIPVLGVQFALARILYLATFTALAFRAPLTADAISPAHSEVGVAILSLFLNAAAYTVASWYLERVLPRRYGVPLHPCFCIPARHRRWCRWNAEVEEGEGSSGSSSGSSSAQPALRREEHSRSLLSGFSLNDGGAGGPVAGSGSSSSSGSGSAASGASQLLFSYLHTWAAAAGLASLPQAARVYAKGEDSDVYAARQEVEELWEELQQGGESAARVHARYPVVMRHLRKTFKVDQAKASGAEDAAAAAAASASSFSSAGTPLLAAAGEEVLAAALSASSATSSLPFTLSLSSAEAGPITPDTIAQHLGSEADMRAAAAAADATTLPSASSPRSYREVEQSAMLAAGSWKVAVSDASLALGPGVFGLLGENGAGKTTTLAMLQGLYPPTSGSASVGGWDCVAAQDSVRLCLGVCPQHDVLWPMLTVREHLTFYARAKGCPGGAAEAALVDAMLARIGLSQFSARAAEALSGGMRRRLSVGIAMISASTKVVLLDELTTGLDPASRRAVWRIVDASRRAHPDTLFVLVTHDMAEVEALCSGEGGRCAIMTHGRLRCTGSVQHLRERYGGGCLLRIAFSAVRWVGEGEAGRLGVGAVLEGAPPTPAWLAAQALVLGLFPPGRGSAVVDGGVFQTRALALQGEGEGEGEGGAAAAEGSVAIKEGGSAVFVVRVGSALAAGAEVSMASAFQAMKQQAGKAGITSWAIEAQTLDAVFARVVRHYKK